MIEREIVDKIEKYNKIIIVRHKRPDGDALGSTFGLRAILRESFPEKRIYCFGLDSADYLRFLGSDDETNSDNAKFYEDALIIAIDTATKERISNAHFAKGKEIIKIDHHIIEDNYGDINWVEEENIAACCMIIKLWLANKERLQMTKEAATCLYTGLVTDSGRFKYSGIDKEAMECAGALLEYNIDIEWIYANLYLKDYKNLIINATLARKAKITENGVCYLYVTKKMMRKYKMTYEEASSMISILDGIKGSLIYLAFIDNEDGTIRVRLRSRFTTVNEIASNHHGGGHAKASGAICYSKKEMKDIINEADIALKNYKENNKGWM